MSVQDILSAVREGRVSAEEAKRALRSRSDAGAVRSTDELKSFEPIAVVGISGRYPQAADLDCFWENLRAGKDAIGEIPRSRWDVDQFFDPTPPYRGKIYCKWIGALEDVDCFDPLFFSISPADAEMMDPQHRMFMEESYHAFEDAGYGSAALSSIRCGVYFGVMSAEYSMLSAISAATPGNMAGTMTGNSHSIGAARIAYHLNLKGPALAIDTACSSSLVAAHLACQALRNHEIDMAVAGGATLYLTPGSYIGMCAAGMLSPAGRCKTFDNSADGFVPGEGVGAMIMKRLTDAEADGDEIHGLIIGSGINQDGRTNGITAPSKSSQIELEREVYARFAIDPATIGYVEMHGTGTKLGDPIELEALSTVFREKTKRRGYCAIGSVKSNIGHTSAAAGIASIHKVLLSMRHATLVPSLHFSKPNEHFDFAASPFQVNVEARPWKKEGDQPRRAGISSFGFSGTNAHLVLEQHSDRRIAADVEGPKLVLLSARSPERLLRCAERLLERLDAAPDIDLQDLAYTLQVGRDAMEHRLSLRANTLDEVRAGLRDHLAQRPNPSLRVAVAIDQAEIACLFDDDEEALSTQQEWFAANDIDQLEALWLKGFDLEWHRLYARGAHRRLRLPTYPFEKGRYWLSEQPTTFAGALVPESGTGWLHPLLQRNSSDFDAQRFSSTFTGEEFFFDAHRVGGERMLPAAALLEMAREAVSQSLGLPQDACLRLYQVAWLRPVIASDGQGEARPIEVSIRLQRGDGHSVRFEIFTNRDETRPHCHGKAEVLPDGSAPRLDMDALQRDAASQAWLPGEAHYAIFEQVGISYGDACRSVEGWCRVQGGVLARIVVDDAESGSAMLLHPAALDGAFQSTLGMARSESDTEAGQDGPIVPFALDSLTLFDATPGAMSAWIRPVEGASSTLVRRFDIDLVDETGRVYVEIRGLACRALNADDFSADASSVSASHLQALRYAWEPLAAPRTRTSAQPEGRTERILLIAEDERDLQTLTQSGCAVQLLRLADCLDAEHDALTRIVEEIGELEQVIWIAPSTSTPANTFTDVEAQRLIDAQRQVVACFRVLKVLIDLGYWRRTLRWTLLTQSALGVVPEDCVDASQAGLHGLLGAVSKEYPRWQVTQLDLPSEAERVWPQLQEIESDSGLVLALRDGQWFQQALQPLNSMPAENGTLYRDGGLYVVVGGAGGIGEVWSEWMIRQHDARLVWIGRRAVDAEIEAKLDRLEAIGHRPLYLQADALDRSTLDEARSKIKASHPGPAGAIHGIVNSAVVLGDASIANMSSEAFDVALRAKTDTSVNLARVFADEPLDFILMFSSLQSFFRDAGQANYAAGCAFQDAFALQLDRAVSCAVKVVNWGYWGSTGVADSDLTRQRMAANGVGSIEPEEAMQALAGFMADSQPQMALIKLTGMAAAASARMSTPSSAELAATAAAAAASGYVDGDLRSRTLHFLIELVAAVMKIPPSQIEASRPLQRYGLDSIVAMQLAAALGDVLDDVDSMVFFEHPSLDAMADHLIDAHPASLAAALEQTRGKSRSSLLRLRGGRSAQTVARDVSDSPRRLQSDGIAVIGVAGRYPGARTIDELWARLCEGYDSVQEVPADRWDHSIYFDADKGKLGKTYCRWGSFLDGVDRFDPLFFDISPRAADSLDPQVRLCLQTVWELMEDAAYTRDLMLKQHESRVGVYMGAMYQQYQMLETDYVVNSGVSLSSYAAIANRISNFFDFKGPSVAVDTQCSSAMIALHMACRALRDGECQVAIAGGVNLLIHPKKYLGLSMLFMLGSERSSRSFAEGDGYLPSEGVGAVMLKPLERAEADGDRILGVIKYSGQNHAGRGFGYGTQDPNAQVDLIRTAFERSGIDPRTITYVEASANGTALSDAMEASALIRAHKGIASDAPACAVGSIKSNMGHTESASGIAQLTKVLLQLKHGKIAPLFCTEHQNPNVKFEGSRFHLQTKLEDWPRAVLTDAGRTREFPRRAAINTFGGGGSLAHVIVEEYAPELQGHPLRARPLDAEGMQLIPLSARTQEQLPLVAARLLDHVRANSAMPLSAIAVTLQRGREAMEYRAVILADDIPGLVRGLEQFLANDSETPEVVRSTSLSEQEREHAQHRVASAPIDHARLAKLWASGLHIDWDQEFGADRPIPVALPTYPFEERRCWLEETEAVLYADSKIVRGEFGDEASIDFASSDTESVVYAAICSSLGLDRDELDVDQSLSRYVLLSAFLPRFADYMESHAGIQLPSDLLLELESARQIAELAVRSREEASLSTALS